MLFKVTCVEKRDEMVIIGVIEMLFYVVLTTATMNEFLIQTFSKG